MSLYLYAILLAENLDLVKDINLKGMNTQPVQFQAIAPLRSFIAKLSKAVISPVAPI